MEKTCDTCGNSYDRAFRVELNDVLYHFDCFECAIQKLAPRCKHCHVPIIGHGVEADGHFFCCAHCARSAGVYSLHDHTETAQARPLKRSS